MSGFQLNVKKPSALLVVLPISLWLLLESTTLKVTGTPVASVGRGLFMYTYSIHALWLSSATAGTPLGKRVANSVCAVPAEISVTIPLITTDLPISMDVFGASTVVALGPLP